MSAVRCALMFVDESVDVCLSDGCRLQLSPCGSEFMIDRQISQSAHPLQTRERVRQRTRFTVSEYKALVFNALEFRNKFATYPYLPEEFITVNSQTLADAVTEVEWPAVTADSCNVTCGPQGEITVCSVDQHAKLVLSSSGEEFTVEFSCRSSHSEEGKQYLQPRGTQHKSSCFLNSLSSKPVTVKDFKASAQINSSESIVKTPDKERVELTSSKSRKVHRYTRVVQQFSRVHYPQTWHYPLSIAVKYWESKNTRINKVTGQATTRHTDVEDIQRQTELQSPLPDALPLKCPFPHQHRWRYESVNPDFLEQKATTELVKVVWCQNVLYRIIDGVMPVIEISPGDGSVIRSNGGSANYFTHHRAGPPGAVESVYYLGGLPPDVPGQNYSVRSVVTRASRILKCFIQAQSSLRTPLSFYCWKEQAAACDCVSVVKEVKVSGPRYSKALSDGTADVLFQDRIRTLSLQDGHQTMVQMETDEAYQRSVVSELEKIKRFNFLLENSPALRSTERSLSCESGSDIADITLAENCISEALKKTSKAIQDINALLSNTNISE